MHPETAKTLVAQHRDELMQDSVSRRGARRHRFPRWHVSWSRAVLAPAVAPGITQTPLLPPESYTPEALAGELPPLGRVGQVSDIVDGILYLESAPYVTGEILYIDGGRTA